jgi:hypothetical protein
VGPKANLEISAPSGKSTATDRDRAAVNIKQEVQGKNNRPLYFDMTRAAYKNSSMFACASAAAVTSLLGRCLAMIG